MYTLLSIIWRRNNLVVIAMNDKNKRKNMHKKILYFITLAFLASPSVAQLEVVGQDSTKPIEITADSLEVLQGENKAIFSGDVNAKQGQVDIKSSKMTVFYKKSADKKDEAKSEQRQTSSEGKVSKVEIDDKVFISTPKETAQGNKGVYEVDAGTITLTGNVTLTSGKNIVKGEKLVYNIKTRQSKIVSGADNKNATGKKERVRGVFIPGGN